MSKYKDYLIGQKEQRETEYGGLRPRYTESLLEAEQEYLYGQDTKTAN